MHAEESLRCTRKKRKRERENCSVGEKYATTEKKRR